MEKRERPIEIELRKKYELQITSTREKITNSVLAILFGIWVSVLIYKGWDHLYKNYSKFSNDKNKELIQKAKSESLTTLKKYWFNLSIIQLYFSLNWIYDLKNDWLYWEETFKAIKIFQSKKWISVDWSFWDETAIHLILDGFCDNWTCNEINKNMNKLIYEFQKIWIEVEWIQTIMKNNWYYNWEVDWIFGINTYKAILKYIVDKWLEVDPIYDPYHTVNEIKKSLESSNNYFK